MLLATHINDEGVGNSWMPPERFFESLDNVLTKSGGRNSLPNLLKQAF